MRWLAPPALLTLHDEIHVWLVHLEVAEPVRERLEGSLHSEELERARRYRFSRDRQRFVVRRAALRSVLARYLKVRATDIRFRVTCHGKPELDDGLATTGLGFNVTHSNGWAMFAMARHRNVGVDLEHINPGRADPQVAARFFASGELASLRTLPGHDWVTGFFNCWSRKEAYIKATGEGLYFPLDAFEVSLAPGLPARLLRVSESPQERERWAIVDLHALPGYAAALATEKPLASLRCWRWQP